MSKDKDRIADALAALSAGHVEDEHDPDANPHADEHTAHADPVDPADHDGHVAFKEQSAVDAPSATPTQATSRPARPSTPGGAESRAPAPVKTPPVPTTAPSPAPAPAAPAPVAKLRAATPVAAPAPRAARPERPAAPLPAASEPAAPSVPTPSSSYRPPSASKRKRRVPMYATLSFRQTIIPICLSMGAGLVLAMLGWFMLDPDHPARGVGAWAPITIGVVGLAVLGLGIANMLSVQKILNQTPQ